MIGKAPATGTGFKGLINYLALGKLAKKQADRVAWSDVRNLAVDDLLLVPRIMRATANQSTRCPKPVYHLVVSWHKHENPTEEKMRLVGDTTLADLGLLDHQTLFIAHHDTEHRHLHIVVNRVHPETGKAWDRWQDWPRVEKSLARQAKQLGFLYVPGRHTEPERFKTTAKRPRNAEFRMAERLAAVDLLRGRWTKEQIALKRPALIETFERSRSWPELCRALIAQDLMLVRKGQGIVIGDATGSMKLSELGRQIRLKTLEERFKEPFADYETRRDAPQPAPAAQPVDGSASSSSPVASHPKPSPADLAPSQVASPAAGDEDAGQTSATPPLPGHRTIPIRAPKQDPESPATVTDESSNDPACHPADDGVATAGRRPQPKRIGPAQTSDRATVVTEWRKRVAAVEAEQASEKARKAEEVRQAAAAEQAAEAAAKRAAFLATWQQRVAQVDANRAREQRETEDKKLADVAKLCGNEARAPQDSSTSQSQRPTPVERSALPHTPPASPPKPQRAPDKDDAKTKARDAAYDAKAKADETADLAHTLYGAGLVTRKQLARAVRERENAQSQVEKTKSGQDKLKRELREALTPDKHTLATRPGRKAPSKISNKDDEPVVGQFDNSPTPARIRRVADALDDQVRPTPVADEVLGPTNRLRLGLEYRYLPVLVAMWARPMRLSGAAFRRLQDISERPVPRVFQLIALFLCFPCFKASNFCFKVAYLLQQRRALLLSRYCAAHGLQNFRLEFDPLLLEGRSVAQAYHRLRDILGRLKRRHDARDFADPNHDDHPAT